MERISVFVIAVVLLSGCTALPSQGLPGGARYKLDLDKQAQTLSIDVTINNDSEMVNVEMVVDPVTGKVVGLKFGKRGTEGSEVMANYLVQQQASQTVLIETLLRLLPGVAQ